MRPKKFDRKLVLNKKTIARLNEEEVKRVRGGKPAPLTYTCNWVTVCGSNPCC